MKATLWEAAELGRLLYTHHLDPEIVTHALEVDEAAACQLLNQGSISNASGLDDLRVALTLNIFVRLEVRCCHDTAALIAALERPAEQLEGASIADRLRQAVDISELRLLREAAGNVAVPKVKMWRVPDTS